jgi:hypothetical protein
MGPAGKQPMGTFTFAFQRNYKLTQVKVVLAEEARTNKYAHALWHRASKNGSQPVDGILPSTAEDAVTSLIVRNGR